MEVENNSLKLDNILLFLQKQHVLDNLQTLSVWLDVEKRLMNYLLND